MNLKLIALAIATASIAACATPGYTPAEDADAFGYSEQTLGEQQFRVTYNGRQMLRDQRLAEFVLRRAAEITLEEGYEWFTIANPEEPVAAVDAGQDVRVIPASGRGSVLGYNGLRYQMQQRTGNTRSAIGNAQPQRPRMSITIDITLGEGVPPADALGFYAKDILGIPETA